jgi:hypothetical protein
LRRRMIEDMSVRKFTEKTQHESRGHLTNCLPFVYAIRPIPLLT